MTKNLSYYPSLDNQIEVYKPGPVTLITGKTVAHRYFIFNLMIEQLLNNEDAVCFFIPDTSQPQTTYELISILGFKLDPVDKIKALGLLASWTGSKNTRLIIPKSTDFDPDCIDTIFEVIESQEKITHIFIESIHAIPTYKVKPDANSLIRAIMVCLNCIARDKAIPIVMGIGENNPDSKRNKLGSVANTPVGDFLPSSIFSSIFLDYSKLILGVDIELNNVAPMKIMIHILKGDRNKEVSIPILLDYYPAEAVICEQVFTDSSSESNA